VAIAVVALGSFALLLSLQAVLDNDIWWHLAAGRWIAEHRAVPRTDPFSTGGEHKPWVAYAWLFELLIWWLHQHLGLLGIVAYRAGFAVAIALAAWRLVQKREPRVAVAAVITLVTIAAMRPVLTERSWLFTTLFFALSLDAIVDLREGRPRSPWPLAVGYAIWASTHIQFIYGLFAIGVVTIFGDNIRKMFGASVDALAGNATVNTNANTAKNSSKHQTVTTFGSQATAK
jgi:hypothetical protein